MYGKLAAETGNTNAMFYIKTFLNRPNALFGGCLLYTSKSPTASRPK